MFPVTASDTVRHSRRALGAIALKKIYNCAEFLHFNSAPNAPLGELKVVL